MSVQLCLYIWAAYVINAKSWHKLHIWPSDFDLEDLRHRDYDLFCYEHTWGSRSHIRHYTRIYGLSNWCFDATIQNVDLFVFWGQCPRIMYNVTNEDCQYMWGACGWVDRVLESRSKGLGLDSYRWSCIEVPGKPRNSMMPRTTHCYGYLEQRSRVGSIVADCHRRPLLLKWVVCFANNSIVIASATMKLDQNLEHLTP